MDAGPSYPDPLPWSHRASAMPWLPGGNDGQLATLKAVLLTARSGAFGNTEVALGDPPGGETIRLSSAGSRLQPTGLLSRGDHDVWLPSPDALSWLETEDPTLLIAVLHSRVRFVGELMALVAASPRTHAELNDLGTQMYQLNWSTLDQVRRRTAWLRATGFAELRFDNVVELTPAGEQLLRCLKLADPIQMDDQVAEVHLGEPAE